MTGFFVALDFPDLDVALRVAHEVSPHVAGFKVGYELLHGPDPHCVERVAELGRPVFADAKLHDIPASVAAGARQLGRRGARWVTAHAGGSGAMISAAVEGLADGSGGRGGILAVSVLTSLDLSDLEALGISENIEDRVARLVGLASDGGVEGAVCSVAEVAKVREAGPGLITVTPGIRLEPGATDDQKRVARVGDAVAAGADYMVIGRPITRSADPAAVAAQVAAELGAVNG